MGKLYDSLLSGTSGRTGRIVVANVYGNEISRIRPKKRSGQPTAKQLLIRNRMKRCAAFIQSYKAYACRNYGTRSGMKSPYNMAMTNLMENFLIDYDKDTITPDYPQLAFSRGSLMAAVPQSPTVAGDMLEIRWQDNSGGNPDRAADQAQILVAAEGENLSFFAENAASRADSACSLNLPVNFRGRILHVWIAFRAADGALASNSQYTGTAS